MTNNQVSSGRVWSKLAVLIGFLSILGLQIPPLRAQVVGATLSGTVNDASGAVVPKADITITDTDTGVTRTVSTNDAGFYSAPNLLPGPYTVTAKAAGFAAESANLILTIGQQQALNLVLKVGTTTQSVEITTEAPAVDLVEPTLGGLNNETTILELPLNGRSWSDLASLQPGVYAIRTQASVLTNITDRSSRGIGDQLAIAGARPRQNNYRLDGISINDPSNGAPGSVMGGNIGVDALSEFSVLTGSFSAEYGRSSGGVVNAVTKSGTNGFHGDVYEFLRNSALDARNYFDGATIPPLRRNQFGASVGGPIKKDKTFIFGDYEGLRQYRSISQVDTVPSAAARAGNLSTGQVAVDPQATRYLNEFYPLPNGSVFGNTGLFEYPAAQPITENFFTLRVDHHISDTDTLAATYLYDFANIQTDDEFGIKAVQSITHRQFATLEENHIFNPNIVNNLRVGFNRVVDGLPLGYVPLRSSASDSSFGFVPGTDAGQIRITGLTTFSGGLSAAGVQSHTWSTYQFYDDAQVTKGINSIKFGGGVERDQWNLNSGSPASAVYTFNNLADFLTNQPFAIQLSPARLDAHWRQSIFGAYIEDVLRVRTNLTVDLGLRWEMYTVPYEINGKEENLINFTDPLPSVINHNLCAACPTFNGPLFQNNSKRDFDPRVGFAWDPFHSGKTSVRGGFGIYDQLILVGQVAPGQFPVTFSASSHNLAPGSFPTEAAEATLAGSNPNRPSPVGISTQHVETDPKRGYVMQWNLNVQRAITPSLTAQIGYVGSRAVHGATENDDADVVLPLVTSLPGTAEYLWPCQAPGLPFVPAGSTPPPGLTPGCNGIGTGSRYNPNLGKLRDLILDNNSATYNGLEFQVTKRMSHGVQVQGSFTYSRVIDVASDSVVGDAFQNGISSLLLDTQYFNTKLTRAPADFDSPRFLALNYIWDVPTPKSFEGLSRKVLSGWEFGGILTASDGQPFTALIAGDAVGDLSGDPFSFPDRLRGKPGCQSLVNPGNVANYIKLQCFTLPPAVVYNGVPYLRWGNEGRNAVWGPGLMNLDLSLVKNTPVRRISESFNVQFRAELFNIVNHSNFLAPIDNETIFDPSIPGFGISPTNIAPAIIPGAGAIDNTTTTSRQIQFALKLIW